MMMRYVLRRTNEKFQSNTMIRQYIRLASVVLVMCCAGVHINAQEADKKNDLYNTFDFIPDVPDSVIEARISTIDSEIDITFNQKVRRFIDYFAIENRDYMRKMLRRKDTYFPIFEAALAEHGLPDDLKYLTIVESGINPTAKSHAGALGMWQFMPSTGKMFKLNYDYYVDERMDPYKSTQAACLYLKQLYNMFDDWELALASYNCGPGNVRRAIRRSGYKDTFWEIYPYLPRETRSYVPQFMAVNYLMRFPDEHNLYIDKEEAEYISQFEVVEVNQYFNIDEFCKVTGVCKEDLLKLNPEIKRDVITENHSHYDLRIPAYIHEYYKENSVAILDSAKKKGSEQLQNEPAKPSYSTEGKERIIYTVRSGDVLGKIAERYQVSLYRLRLWNNIGSNNMIRAGQRLTIYKDPNYLPTKKPQQTAAKKSAPSNLPDDYIYTVQPGDTLWSISKKFDNLTVEQIKKLNNLSGDDLRPGQKLKLS